MKKIILILVVAVAVYWFFQKRIAPQSKNPASSVLSAFTETIKKKSTKETGNVLVNVKNLAQNTVIDTGGKVNEFLEEKTQAILGSVLGTTAAAPVVSTSDVVPPNAIDSLITIDFLGQRGTDIKIKKGRVYYFSLKNVPDAFCLQLDGKKYEVTNDSYLKITFPAEGKHQISFDYCKDDAKHFGQIVVE